jgi:hypothetical protein
MSVIATGKKTHDDAANASEATRQSAVRAAGVTQAAVTAAEILHYQNVVASSRRCVISGREFVMGHG